MNKNAVAKTAEIKLGCATYCVKREFVGASTREELLINRLLERCTGEAFSVKKQTKPESKR